MTSRKSALLDRVLRASVRVGLAGLLVASVAEGAQTQPVAMKMLCESVQNVFARSSLTRGSLAERWREAKPIARAFLEQVRGGARADYLSLGALGLTDADRFSPSGKGVSLAGTLAAALGQSADSVIVRSVDELRYLPYALDGVDVLIFTDDAKDLTEQRAKIVANVALRKQIKISTVWLGSTGEYAEDQRAALSLLAEETKGRFVALTEPDAACFSDEPSYQAAKL